MNIFSILIGFLQLILKKMIGKPMLVPSMGTWYLPTYHPTYPSRTIKKIKKIDFNRKITIKTLKVIENDRNFNFFLKIIGK